MRFCIKFIYFFDENSHLSLNTGHERQHNVSGRQDTDDVILKIKAVFLGLKDERLAMPGVKAQLPLQLLFCFIK